MVSLARGWKNCSVFYDGIAHTYTFALGFCSRRPPGRFFV